MKWIISSEFELTQIDRMTAEMKRQKVSEHEIKFVLEVAKNDHEEKNLHSTL